MELLIRISKIIIKHIIILLFTCSVFLSCSVDKKVKHDQDDPNKIQLHFSQNLKFNNSRFINMIDDYINKIERDTIQTKRKYLYQMIIGQYLSDGTAEIILSIERRKSSLKSKFPIGYFKYRGRIFLVYSAISEFCYKDSSVLSIYNNLDNYLYNDLVPGYDTMKINTSLIMPYWDFPSYLYKLKGNSFIYERIPPEKVEPEKIKKALLERNKNREVL